MRIICTNSDLTTVNTGVTHNLKKDKFLTIKFDYVNHVSSPGKVEVVWITTAATQVLSPLKDVTIRKVFSFICCAYNRLVLSFAIIVFPLNKNLKLGKPKRLSNLTEQYLNTFYPGRNTDICTGISTSTENRALDAV